MNNREIEDLIDDLPVEVVCAEEVHLSRPKCYVANTDRCSGRGLHWVVFYVPRRGPIEFFDSLGNTPDSYDRHFGKELAGRSYIYTPNRLQGLGSDTCGAYCVYFVKKRYEGLRFEEIVKIFDGSDWPANDRQMITFIRRLKLEQ